MTHKADIGLLVTTLQEGETTREICPACSGGLSGERSLSVTRTSDGYLYHCFRAKCEVSGGTGSGTVLVAAPKKRRRSWEGTTYELPDKVRERIQQLWQMPPHEDWWWTTDYGGRLAMSIRSPKFQHRGWCLRAIADTEGPKALTYIDEGQQGLSWYKTHPHMGTVLVEDVPSAVRASSYVNSVALLGTGIGMDRALEIADNAPRPLIVALDQDATDLSFRWARKYSTLWGEVKVLPLKKDIKNMKEEAIKELLQGDSDE